MKKFLSFTIIVLFFLGCSTTPKRPSPNKGAETIIFFNDVFQGIVEEYNNSAPMDNGEEKK